MQLPRVGAVHKAGCDGACGNRVGALPPYTALFTQHPSGDANGCTQLAQLSSSGERGQSQPSVSSITSSLHKGSQADSASRAAGFRQSSSQVSICGFVVFVCGGSENRVIH